MCSRRCLSSSSRGSLRAMPQSKSSGRSSRSKASTARKASSSTRKSSNDAATREQLQRFLDPREVVVVTRERLQEVLDEAVARGRMTRDDAGTMLADLLQRAGDAPTAAVTAVGEARKRARDTARGAGKRARDAGDPVLATADRARRAAGVGPSFPILGYDDLTAAQVQSRLDGLSPAELRKVRDYEKRNANRKSVLNAVESKLS